METYHELLYYFCALLAHAAKVYEEMLLGVCPASSFQTVLRHIEISKNMLLEVKSALGLKGGISFLEDFRFDPDNPFLNQKIGSVFGNKDGFFYGNKQTAFPTLLKWSESTQEELLANPYRYEKAVFLLSLLFWGNEET